MDKPKLARIGIWVLSVVTAALFLLSAVPKFAMAGWVSRFAAWGYPEWFLYVIGALEAAGAIGLLIPRVAHLAAGGLILIMFGAAYTHLTNGEPIWANLVYFASLSVIGIYRWRHRQS